MLSTQGSPNYAAAIIEYDPANEVILPNRDRVVGYKALGYQSIIQKGAYKPGELLVVFGAETQLSEDYARENNLFAHEHLNADPTQKGYLGDNRRVRAIQFAGNRSDALVMPIESLGYAFAVRRPVLTIMETIEAGQVFDHIGETEVCRKYVVPVKASTASLGSQAGAKRSRIQTEHFPEHFDTANGFRNIDQLQDDDYVVVTQKLHGTSVRIANVPVERDLTWLERLLVKLRLAEVA